MKKAETLNRMMSESERVLVIGGAGYIGSWVTRHLLAEEFKVTVFDNLTFGGRSLLGVLGHPRYTFIKGDIRDRQALATAMKGIDHVIHLAALVGEAACDLSPEVTVAINFEGTKNVVKAAVNQGVRRLIFFSTCSSYGVQDTDQMATEETRLNPVSLYARTKIDAEKFLLDTMKRDLSRTIFRPATVHGPSARMRFDLIVNHLVCDAVTKHRLSIYGPQMWRPLMWVGDAAKAVELALRAEHSAVRNEVFNVGATEANYRKGEIGEIVQKRAPTSMNLEYEGTDKDLRSYRVDFSKIKQRLGFTLSKTLDEAVADLFQLFAAGVIHDPDSSEYRNA